MFNNPLPYGAEVIQHLGFVLLLASAGACVPQGGETQHPGQDASLPTSDSSPKVVPGQVDAAGIYNPGGDVTPPVLVYQKSADFSRKDRKHRFKGTTTVRLIVGVDGLAQDVALESSCGMTALDAKAVEMVSQYRFKPALKSGEPVPVKLLVEVDFEVK